MINYPFFNNSGADLDLRYAERIDDLTFRFKGPVTGANTSTFDAVPSLDRNNFFYFISTRNYADTSATIFRGKFANGALTSVEQMLSISAPGYPLLDFDCAISDDGNSLYYATGI